MEQVRFSSPLVYEGNLLWLILALIILLPVGILMLMRRGYFVYNNSRFKIRYHGSWCWLYFWGLVCFPVAICLLIFRGTDIVETENI